MKTQGGGFISDALSKSLLVFHRRRFWVVGQFEIHRLFAPQPFDQLT
jgi:hypothetical protein